MAAADESGSSKISIVVKSTDGEQITFKVKKKTPARKIMDAYCKQNALSSDAVRFSFDGVTLDDPEKAIKHYGMEEGSVIEVFAQQQGGAR